MTQDETLDKQRLSPSKRARIAADRAQEAADHAQMEADQSKREADQAKMEADKAQARREGSSSGLGSIEWRSEGVLDTSDTKRVWHCQSPTEGNTSLSPPVSGEQEVEDTSDVSNSEAIVHDLPVTGEEGESTTDVEMVHATALRPDIVPSTLHEEESCEICRVTEARIDLHSSHAFLTIQTLLDSLGEQFTHTHFQETEDGWMIDEYRNEYVVVTYCLNSNGRDQLRVRWIDPEAEEVHNDDELPALTRRIARAMGGGSNLHLVDRFVQLRKDRFL